MAISDYYTSGWSYKTVTNGKDSGGALTITYGAAVKFNGFIQKLSATEQRRHGKDSVLSTHIIFAPATCLVKENCVVYDPDGREYKVLYVDNVNRLDHHKEIECQLVR